MKEFLQRAYGLKAKEIVRLNAGNSSCNWRVTCEDGTELLLKRIAPGLRTRLERALAMLRTIDSPLVARPLADGRIVEEAGALYALASWLPCENRRPEELTAAEVRSLVRACAELSRVLPAGLVHGDLNFTNVLFREGEVTGFVDFEMVHEGQPVEDLLRVFLHRAERLPCFACRRHARLRDNFALAVAEAGFDAATWLGAIDDYRLNKEAIRRRKARFAWVAELDVRLRARTFARFAAVVRQRLGGRGGEGGRRS